MGITGLLPFLQKATKPCHVSEFRGGTVVIDAYCWLHKGATACAEQLAQGEDCQMYVHYCMKYVKLLQQHNIHPILIFDGRNLPAKAETELKRRESRNKAKQRAAELLRLGKREEAYSYLRQCVDITPKMAHNLIKECRKMNVDCIVAPYESDAQLAFLNLKGIAEVVITEDSDLVLFGCSKVLYKLDLNGYGQLVEADKIYLSMSMRPDEYTIEKLRYMCIISGCDYVKSLEGIGLKKAHKFITLTQETDPDKFLNKIPRYLNKLHLKITDEYKKSVMKANATFLHQTVFDPFTKKLVPLTDPEKSGTNPDHCVNCGDIFDDYKAYQVAIGNLDPYNFEKYDDWTPTNVPSYSIWSRNHKKRISHKLEKENSKEQFKKYFKSIEESSVEIKEEEYVENEQEELVDKIRLYQSIKNDKEQEITEEPEIKPVRSKSPVLNKNPFLTKKKLSKFPQTPVDHKSIVRSKYFCEIKEEKIEESDIIKIEDNEDDGLDSSQKENNADDEDTCEIVQVSKKLCIEEISETNDIQQKAVTSVVTKKSVGTCRRVGLPKRSKGQQTLHNFFGAANK